MIRDRSPIWIGIADFLLCCLGVVIVAVNPVKAKTEGIKPKAEFLLSADWPLTLDVDIDLWLVGPERKPVFYGSRQVGCADLDRDSLGFRTSRVMMSDGSMGQQDSNKETISIRCLNPGHYDVAVNYFSNHGPDNSSMIPVHVDLTGLNPSVRSLLMKDVALGHAGQTINVFSFDMDKDGNINPTDIPLEPLTRQFEKGARP